MAHTIFLTCKLRLAGGFGKRVSASRQSLFVVAVAAAAVAAGVVAVQQVDVAETGLVVVGVESALVVL